MKRLFARSAPSIQHGLTLIELMIAMLLGLIVVGGVLGIFVANSETNRRTDDLARIQENARVAMQFMGRSIRETSGNPCGVPPGKGLIIHTTDVPPAGNWWSGGNDFTSSLWGYAGGTGFPANGSVPMAAGSDAAITVSGNYFAKIVISDSPPNVPMSMTVPSKEGLAANDILFACSAERGRGVVFKAGQVSASGAQWQVVRAKPFEGPVASMPASALGKIHAEGWFVGQNTRGGTSLFRTFLGDGGVVGQPEEIAPDVSSMSIIYLLPDGDDYVPADQIAAADWLNVIAAYIELTISRRAGNDQTISRTVGLTVNIRNRFDLSTGNSGEGT
jgi:type IV pilus assembly protein PilW